MHDAEAVAVSLLPFEIIKEGPQEIPADVRPFIRSTLHIGEIGIHKVDAVGIMHTAVQGQDIVTGHAVLRDIHRHMVTLIEEFQSPVNAFRCHGPAHTGLGDPAL